MLEFPLLALCRSPPHSPSERLGRMADESSAAKAVTVLMSDPAARLAPKAIPRFAALKVARRRTNSLDS
jgi:hypothetical protein